MIFWTPKVMDISTVVSETLNIYSMENNESSKSLNVMKSLVKKADLDFFEISLHLNSNTNITPMNVASFGFLKHLKGLRLCDDNNEMLIIMKSKCIDELQGLAVNYTAEHKSMLFEKIDSSIRKYVPPYRTMKFDFPLPKQLISLISENFRNSSFNPKKTINKDAKNTIKILRQLFSINKIISSTNEDLTAQEKDCPNDQNIMEHIWNYLNFEDKLNFTLVCKSFNNFVSDMNCFCLVLNCPSKVQIIPKISRNYQKVSVQNLKCKLLGPELRLLLRCFVIH